MINGDTIIDMLKWLGEAQVWECDLVSPRTVREAYTGRVARPSLLVQQTMEAQRQKDTHNDVLVGGIDGGQCRLNRESLGRMMAKPEISRSTQI